MNRRAFLRAGAAGGLSLASASRSAAALEEVRHGQSRLGLSDDGRDGVRYVRKAYKPGTPIPCVMMLHGYAGWADNLKSTFALGEEFGVVIRAPESRGLTWGQSVPGLDDDVRYDRTARVFAPQLKAEGYDVTLREYDGGHGVPREVVREAYQWFVADGKPQ
jgi:hypothetical protein